MFAVALIALGFLFLFPIYIYIETADPYCIVFIIFLVLAICGYRVFFADSNKNKNRKYTYTEDEEDDADDEEDDEGCIESQFEPESEPEEEPEPDEPELEEESELEAQPSPGEELAQKLDLEPEPEYEGPNIEIDFEEEAKNEISIEELLLNEDQTPKGNVVEFVGHEGTDSGCSSASGELKVTKTPTRSNVAAVSETLIGGAGGYILTGLEAEEPEVLDELDVSENDLQDEPPSLVYTDSEGVSHSTPTDMDYGREMFNDIWVDTDDNGADDHDDDDDEDDDEDEKVVDYSVDDIDKDDDIFDEDDY